MGLLGEVRLLRLAACDQGTRLIISSMDHFQGSDPNILGRHPVMGSADYCWRTLK